MGGAANDAQSVARESYSSGPIALHRGVQGQVTPGHSACTPTPTHTFLSAVTAMLRRAVRCAQSFCRYSTSSTHHATSPSSRTRQSSALIVHHRKQESNRTKQAKKRRYLEYRALLPFFFGGGRSRKQVMMHAYHSPRGSVGRLGWGGGSRSRGCTASSSWSGSADPRTATARRTAIGGGGERWKIFPDVWARKGNEPES